MSSILPHVRGANLIRGRRQWTSKHARWGLDC